MVSRGLHWLGAFALWLMPLAAAVAAPHDVVAMIDARHDKGAGGVEFGAGIVVADSPARLVLITALHVVANADGDLAGDIRVEFRRLRGTTFAARAHPAYTDRRLDLAVLFIDRAAAPGLPSVLPEGTRQILSPTRAEGLAGTDVRVVGAMGRQRWAQGLINDRIVDADTNSLRIRSDGASAGASGGAVFDSLGRLVGMASRIDSTTGHLAALPMQVALARLRSWGIDATLLPAEAASTTPELMAQMREGLRIRAELLERMPAAPGGLWPSRNNGRFAFEVSAQLSPALRELVPRIEITFPSHASLEAIELSPPHHRIDRTEFFAMVVDAEVFMTLADRRRIGPLPVRLDLHEAVAAMAARIGAHAQQAVEDSRRAFAQTEVEAAAQKARQEDSRARFDARLIHNWEQAQLQEYPRIFPGWRMRCRQLDGEWQCSGSSHIPRHPARGALANVVHSLKLGSSMDDLEVNLPIDPAHDLFALMPAEAIRLLAGGAQELFVEMRLADGQVLGPKPLCKVRPGAGQQLRCE